MTKYSEPKTNIKPQNWFTGIDSLRFFLAFIVLIGHFFIPAIPLLKDSSNFILKIIGYLLSVLFVGQAAVIGFFIISGFVVHYSSQNKHLNIKQFYIRRFVRIVIPLLVVIFFGSFFGHPEAGICWSLYCELIYYALYPFIIKINISIDRKILLSIVLYILLMVIMTKNNFISFLNQKDRGYNGNYPYLGTFFNWIVGLPCWLAGVKLAESISTESVKPRYLKLTVLRITSWVSAILCLLARFHYYLPYIYSLNIVCFLFYFWIKAEVNYYQHAKPFKWLESWGKFSYSLYLCHTLFLAALTKWLVVNSYNYILFVATIILLSYLFYELVEKRAHNLAKKLARN